MDLGPLLNKDYKEMLRIFAKHRVRYLVIGAYAVIYYTEPRYTKDFDIWVDHSLANARRVYAAVAEFGAPVAKHGPEDFAGAYGIYQIGVEPVRIDILSNVEGVRFSSAWERRKTVRIENFRVHIISKQDLIRAKRSAGRRRDLDDLDWLTEKV